jgi:hypothetical protein
MWSWFLAGQCDIPPQDRKIGLIFTVKSNCTQFFIVERRRFKDFQHAILFGRRAQNIK